MGDEARSENGQGARRGGRGGGGVVVPRDSLLAAGYENGV